MTKKVMAGLAVLALCIGAPGTVHAADLITNGSFETITGNDGGQLGYNTFATGWTNAFVPTTTTLGYNFLFPSGTADTTGVNGSLGGLLFWGPGNGSGSANYSNNGLPASSPDGGNFIAMDGAFNVSALQQTITGLTPGDTYAVSFYWAGAQQSGYDGGTTEQFQVSLDSDTQFTSIVNNDSHGFTGWQAQTFNYVASAASETLSFLAIGTPNGEPPFSMLDGVSMLDVSATPEPSAFVAMFAGVIGVGIFARRRSRTKKSAA